MLRFTLFFCEILFGWCSLLPEKFVTVLFLVGKLVMTFDPDLVKCTLVTYHMKELLITFETLQVLALNDNRGQSYCLKFKRL